MRITCDLDGVLADMTGALDALAREEGTPDGFASLSARRQARIWQRIRKIRNFWESLKEREPGAVKRFQHLTVKYRWDVLFVTQRPGTDGRTAQEQSQRWLHRHGFDLPAVYTTQGSRGRIAAALTIDAHIDDRVENCVDVASESKAWPILVWGDEESRQRVTAGSRKMGIAVVATFAEALDKLEETSRAE